MLHLAYAISRKRRHFFTVFFNHRHTAASVAALLHTFGFGHLVLDHGLRSALLFHEGKLFTDHRFRFFHVTTSVKFTAFVGLHELFANLLRDAYALRRSRIISNHCHQVMLSFGLGWHVRPL